METKAVILKLSPDKQAGLELVRWGLQPETLERPDHRRADSSRMGVRGN